MTRRQALLFGLGLGATIVILALAVVVIHPNEKIPTSPAGDTTQSISTNSVQIQNYAFTPMAIKVKAGTNVTWTNTDSVHHNVTADTAATEAPNGPLFAQGEKYSFRFTKAGSYAYHCMPHPYMHGTVIVTD
ncbi:MAG: plastocyanin/azurin family copper-binding protein [Candidatus Saccharibacteria bacterium]